MAKFRENMLLDEKLRYLFDYTDSNNCFPGVDIAGGICYFLWDREHSGDCKVVSIRNGESFHSTRRLYEHHVFLRYEEALSIIEKIQKFEESFFDGRVSSQKPFGLRTYVKPTDDGDIILRYGGGTGKFWRSEVTSCVEWIDKWKVIISYLTYDHAGRPDKEGKRRIFSTMEVLPPESVCTETYLVVDVFNSKEEAENLVSYLRTSFVRFLVAQLTSTQHLSKSSFAFVPIQNFENPWTDEKLYSKYGLTEEEIAFIESMIRPMELNGDSNEEEK